MSRKPLIRLLFLFLLLITAGTSSAQDTGTVNYMFASDVQTFNPILWSDSASSTVVGYLWPRLFNVDPVTGDLLPGLATWTISDDGLTYTFELREDAVWSDGTPITANDVAFTLRALQSDQVTSFQANTVQPIESINVIDDSTIEITLGQVDCTFLRNLNIGFVPAHRFAPDYSDFMTNPINSNPDISGGPFMLDEWSPDEFVRFSPNPTYYGGAPNFNLLIRIIPDPAVQREALLSGQADIGIIPSDFRQQVVDAGYNTALIQVQSLVVLWMNLADPANPQPGYDADGNPIEQGSHPIFGDINVRRAVTMGWDKAAVIEAHPDIVPLVGTVSPIVPWAYNSALTPPAYDPEGAAALLEESGWVDSDGDGVREKDGTPLAFTLLLSNSSSQFTQDAALVMQDQLNQIGFDVEIVTQEFGSLWQGQVQPQTYDAFISPLGWGAPEPHVLTDGMLNSASDVPGGGLNVVSYQNAEIDSLLAQAKAVPGCSNEERGAFYQQISEIAQQDVAMDFVGAAQAGTIVAFSPRLSGYASGDGSVWALNPFGEWTLSE